MSDFYMIIFCDSQTAVCPVYFDVPSISPSISGAVFLTQKYQYLLLWQGWLEHDIISP